MKFCLLTMMLVFSATASEQLPTNYQTLKSHQKQSLLWANVTSNEYSSSLPTSGPGFLDLLGLINETWLKPTFEHASDELPLEANGSRRKKLLHTFGSVGLVKYVPTKEHGFSGMWANEAIGMARLSLAASPGFFTAYTPGMALKLFVDGQASVNLHVMNSLEGQGKNTNFFLKTFSNRIAEPKGFVLRQISKVFQKAMDSIKPGEKPTFLPINHFAKVEATGDLPFEVVRAHTVLFQPQDLNFSANSSKDFRELMTELSPGTVLYKVFLSELSSPNKFQEVGELVLESRMVASEYGDKMLFFQHNIK